MGVKNKKQSQIQLGNTVIIVTSTRVLLIHRCGNTCRVFLNTRDLLNYKTFIPVNKIFIESSFVVGCFDFLLRDPAPNTKQDETPAIKRSAPPPAAAAAMVVVSKPGEGVCSGAVGVVVGGWGEDSTCTSVVEAVNWLVVLLALVVFLGAPVVVLVLVVGVSVVVLVVGASVVVLVVGASVVVVLVVGASVVVVLVVGATVVVVLVVGATVVVVLVVGATVVVVLVVGATVVVVLVVGATVVVVLVVGATVVVVLVVGATVVVVLVVGATVVVVLVVAATVVVVLVVGATVVVVVTSVHKAAPGPEIRFGSHGMASVEPAGQYFPAGQRI